MKYIIVGGVAGGATAAARLRRIDEQSEIILLEKGKYISYANCGLPYYIGDTIKGRDKLFLQTPESFGGRFRIDVRVENEVVAIDVAQKQVTIRKASGGEYAESYDKLLLSPGASPVKPPIPGIDSERIFTLRNVADTDRIKAFVSTHAIRKVTIVGAGFIGLEMAENLHRLGAEVSIVEMIDQVMAPIDYSMATLVHQHLVHKGVTLHLQEAVAAFAPKGNEAEVTFKSGKRLLTDLVILSIGVRPETSLAKSAGLKIGETGGIWVNEFLQTSDTSIYAVGDAIEYPHPITGKPWLNYLAGPANRQGRIVADNLSSGNTVRYEGSIGTSIAKVFDMTVASTGLAAKKLKQEGIDYRSSTTHSGSHAGYYPGALPLSLKLTFDPKTGRIYGAQGVGFDGVDKRIDQLAQLIKRGGTIFDLIETEHAYAPPFSSAKDPITIAGYVADNILNGAMPVIYWRDVRDADLSKIFLLDVRTTDEYELGHIAGAAHIPLDSLRDRLSEIPTDRPIYLYCQIGLRGYLAQRILQQRGYLQTFNLSGGYKLYSAATATIQNKITETPVAAPEQEAEQEDLMSKMGIKTMKVDACGLQCPGPILKMKKSIEEVNPGDRLEMIATDAGFVRDAQSWCNLTGNKFISQEAANGTYKVIIEKGIPKEHLPKEQCSNVADCKERGKSFILFSDDLDKALATFVLANGAAATGEKVTIFFTFWGLNAIKKDRKPTVSKDMFGKMFSMMLPSSSKKLKLSKMNMGGMGSAMMRYIMKKKNIDSLETLRAQAIEAGIEFIACQMSMDVMGVKREELMDEVTIGGVATYMERADQSNLNLFI